MSTNRIPIPQEISDEVLFRQDHTCCVCRENGKAVQIHHIDDNPSNNSSDNLAVLCLQHHNDTQVSGGFGRRLKAGEVRKYRDDWIDRVTKRREEADKIASERMGNAASTAQKDIRWTRPPQEMLNAYIQHLPELLAVCFAKAQAEWDEGVTSRARKATSELIDILQRVLVYLATWYPPRHFGGKAADVYFSEFIANRYAWHRALNTPNDPGSGGTIVGVLAGGGALDDVLTLISDMVAAQAPGQFDFKEWRERWQRAQQRSENVASGQQQEDARVLEIVYAEDLPECVRDTFNALDGGTEVRRWWVGLRNNSTNVSVDDVSLRAHSNQFVECTIAVAHRPLVLLSQKVAADGDENHLFGRIHTSAMGRLEWVCQDRT